MSHPRKKSGQRKDKKNEKMREDLSWRRAMAKPAKPTTDQPDVQKFKPGAADDFNREHLPPETR